MKDVIEHRTTDTGELAPYPDMTSDDLQDFESFCDEVEGRGISADCMKSALIWGSCIWAALIAALWLGGP